MKRTLRFLIVKTGAIGDLTFALPAPQHLKSRFPGCQVDWAVARNLGPLLQGHPGVDRILTVDAAGLYGDSLPGRAAAALRARRAIPRGYDLVFLFHRSPAYLLFLLGKGPVARMDRRGDSGFFAGTCRIHCPPCTEHESRHLQRTLTEGLRRAGLAADPPAAWQPDLRYLGRSGREGGPGLRIGLHLGGGHNAGADFPLKQWPHMAALGKALLEATPHDLVLFGAEEDRPEADRFLSSLADPGQRARVQDRVGATPLPALVQGIADCAALVGPDSGPLHLADALGIPALGLYGPTGTASWGLLGPRAVCLKTAFDCQPCYRDDGRLPVCAHQHRCMDGLSVATVYATLESMLASPTDRSPR